MMQRPHQVGIHANGRAPISSRTLIALVVVWAAVTLTPGCSWVRNYRSRVCAERVFAEGAREARRNKVTAVEKYFAEALRLAPNSASLHARMGIVYMRMSPPHPARALTHLRRSLELDANQPPVVYLNAILATLLLDRDEQARRLLARAAKKFHNDAMSLNTIGYVLVEADKLTAEALPLLERAVELKPKSSMIIDSLGWAHYRLGNLQQAAQLLERASAPKPKDAVIEYHLGVVYADLGRTEDARTQFRRALQLDPQFTPARTGLRDLRGEQ